MSTKNTSNKSSISKSVIVESEKAPRTNNFVKTVVKRDGKDVQFDLNKVVNAIHKAMVASNEGSLDEAEMVANKVLADLVRITKKFKTFVPTVEGIQDSIEKELILSEYVATAKAYILYREKRSKMRQQGLFVPENVKRLAEESKHYFRNQLAEFVYYRSYSRWKDDEGRRETWIETVDRYMSFMKENIGDKYSEKEYAELRDGILKMEALPSMRLLWSAGVAARRSNVTGYNCTYIAPTSARDISEIMYLAMSGCGVGYSVETETAQQFPIVKRQSGKKIKAHTVGDDKIGWCEAFTLGMETWLNGLDLDFDYSAIRPRGARLMTMGGRASGPEPLIELMTFTRAKVLARQGKRLRNIDVHDIICKVGEVVVSGGVRRTALISLSDLDDEEMRHAKDGQFYVLEPQRALANNSAIYNEKPTAVQFMDEWLALIKSNSGERGIFNRGSLSKQIPERRMKAMGEHAATVGCNPCGEIILRSKQFCNLSEVVCRPEDTEKTLMRKIRLAAMLGTYQSSLTRFEYLSPEWTKNCEEERLLGVSLTGQWDCPAVRDDKVLQNLRAEAEKVNAEYAKKLGINKSMAITCVKPSGTVSQLVDASSGMHPRHAEYYIRRIRISATDSLFELMRDQGVPYHPEVGQTMENANTFVLEFPVHAPKSEKFRDDQTGLEQLEYWMKLKQNYTDHNPSITVSVGEDEWIDVGQWVYKNWDMVGGLSFLPRSNHVYKLAPYEIIDKARYDELVKNIPEIDFSKIVAYEKQDQTQGSKELACMGGTCEI